MEVYLASVKDNSLRLDVDKIDGIFSAAIGNFDGFHKGHQNIVSACASYNNGATKTLVVTFDPHPAAVIKGKAPPYLMTLSEKLSAFKAYGVDAVIVINFDQACANLDAKSFISQLLLLADIRHVVTGIDFRFGAMRAGTIQQLAIYGLEYGFTTQTVKKIRWHSQDISSSHIRKILGWGAVRTASQMTGFPYKLSGIVEVGKGLAKNLLGFPTANISLPVGRCLPCFGVYAGKVCYGPDNKVSWGLANLGIRPTFNNFTEQQKDIQILLEIHLVNEQSNLYGQDMEMELEHFLRPERSFSNINQLIYQINLDFKNAQYLSNQDINAGRS